MVLQTHESQRAAKRIPVAPFAVWMNGEPPSPFAVFVYPLREFVQNAVMVKVRANQRRLPTFSADSLETFVKWLHDNRNSKAIRAENIASFLAVAHEGRGKAGGAVSSSTNSERIKALGQILDANLTLIADGHTQLTGDGQVLANLLFRLADFVAACRGKPYQWRIGGADTAIQWLVSPIIPNVCEKIAKQVPTAAAYNQHRKPVRFFFRTGRTATLKNDLLDSRIHFGVLRKGIIPRNSLTFGDTSARKPSGKKLKAENLGGFNFNIYVMKSAVEEAKRKATASETRFWDELPFAMVGHHRVALGEGKESSLEDCLDEAAPNIQLRCETAIQAANMLRWGYAAVLPSYFPKEQYTDIIEFDLAKEFRIRIPTQILILVSPSAFCDGNATAKHTFDVLKEELQARLRV